MLYDVIIIGGGPAGAAAAIYSARKKLKTLLITDSFGIFVILSKTSLLTEFVTVWIIPELSLKIRNLTLL